MTDETKDASDPPLDCRVGQRIERYLRQLAPHQNEREGPTLLREALDEIERLRDELQLASDTARYACDGWNDALMHEGAHMAAKAIEAKMVPNEQRSGESEGRRP